MEQQRLISHAVTPGNLPNILAEISQKIYAREDLPAATATQQLELLHELAQFDFGRYLLQHKGINGYWTHYMLTHPWFGRKTGKNNRGESLGALESFILNQAPTMLATQERFQIFLQENQKQVKENCKLASIPCGLMGELLYLNFRNIEQYTLFGIDYDNATLDDAKVLAHQLKLTDYIKLKQQDAWKMDYKNELDLISSNGLTIYEPDNAKISALYQQFYQALNEGGKLVTSFLTPPPALTAHCEWDFAHINQEDLIKQKIIFVDLINAKWQCYRSSQETYEQLDAAGFKDIQFIYDKANMFPTVIGFK